MASRKKTAVLISGRGSNLQALLDAAKEPDFPAEISLVISNVADAYGLKRAEAAGVKTAVLSHTGHKTREAYDAALDEILTRHRIDIACLAGFLRILSPGFVEKWQGRMINIHPSLLPKFTGLNTHARALGAGEKIHGCTVHYVTAELDAGPVILQETVPILEGDSEDSLAARVLEAEHRIFPQALAKIAEKL